ncbi:MAG: PP2C family protein-serine/threonine phosphatase [Thermoanaerobaculia bacterium]
MNLEAIAPLFPDGTVSAGDQGIASVWGACARCHERMSRPPATIAPVLGPLVAVCFECLSIAERRALELDLTSAARVQRALLPAAATALDAWEVAYHWQPLGIVSGDHVDVLAPPSPGAPLHLLLGDVAGKGVAASLLQSHLHALFRALAPTDLSLCSLLGRANQLFSAATAAASYATLTALRLFDDGRVELANAGHPRPLVADGRGVRPVEGADLPLGLLAGAGYQTRELFLAPGETLLLYTDGWTEAANVDDEEYGIGRAAASFRRAASLPLPDLLAACRADLEAHLGGLPLGDDLSLLAVRRRAA